MKNKTALLFAIFIPLALGGTRLSASIIAEPACDTLFTTDGKSFLIQTIGNNREDIVFRPCDAAPESKPYFLTKDKILRIGWANPLSHPSKKEDPLVKLSKLARTFTVVGTIFMGSAFLWIPGIILIGIGVMTGERILRKLAKNKNHPMAAKIKKQASLAVKLGLLIIIIPLALILLIFLLI